MQRLTGQALLDHIAANPDMSRPDLAQWAGYVYLCSDGTPRINWVDFYTAKMEAMKGDIPADDGLDSRHPAIVDYEPDVGVYIACLSSSNNGVLYGSWVDLTEIVDSVDMQDCIDSILERSPQPSAEEYACHDWSGIPGVLTGEHTNWTEVLDFVEVLSDLNNEEDKEAYSWICDYHAQVLTKDEFEEMYRGCYGSEADFCEQRAEEGGELIRGRYVNYIDWQRVWEEEYEVNGWTSFYHKLHDQYHIFSAL